MMDCQDVNDRDAIERYLADELSEPDRQSFEDHYFGCADCFERLKLARSLQSHSAKAQERFVTTPYFSGRLRTTIVAICSVVVLAVLAPIYWRGRESTILQQQSENAPAKPSTVNRTVEVRKKEVLIAELAQVEPAPYIPKRLRESGDRATMKFDHAMSHYVRKDYTGAIGELEEVAAQKGKAVDVNFYLGVCYLLTKQPGAAIGALQKAISPEHPDFAEQAHYYLAKAYLQEQNVASAQAELALTLESRGQREEDARRLKQELDNLKPK
jgi:tetratricopeptide (TPR) repeat protein